MASHFQATTLIASLSYPNSIAWSEENLVAIASGHIVTILNPSSLYGPRGLITIQSTRPFQIGVVEREDLLTPCLMPIYLSRDVRPCARSISWSHAGLAPNSGCLLAVCTSEGRVKLYRPPFCEFSPEWVEVTDISDMLYDYFVSINFGEFDVPSKKILHGQLVQKNTIETGVANNLKDSISSKRLKRRTRTSSGTIEDTGNVGGDLPHGAYGVNGNCSHQDTNGGCTGPNDKLVTVLPEVATIPFSTFKQGSSVEVLKQDGSRRIWIRGILERMEAARALVIFPEATDGERDAWIELNIASDRIEDSSSLNGLTNHGPHLSTIRPSMDLGNFPRQILLADLIGRKEILSTGQAVEAWLNNRWVEGFFMGSGGHGLLVKLSGGSCCIALDPTTVRLAPVWNSALQSWQVTLVKIQVENLEISGVVEIQSENSMKNNLHQRIPASKSEGKPLKKRRVDGPPLITAGQYASRNAMLSSVVVSWSPILQLPFESTLVSPSCSNNCAILAVGGKSGKISLWRVHEPQWYNIENGEASVDTVLVGLVEAHNSWITAISWGVHAAAPSSQLILATGSSDGSVKIWRGDAGVLIRSSEVNCTSFSLLKEVITAASVPVSALSLAVPVNSPDKVLLAIGKGSGSLEVWICFTSSSAFQYAGSYNAHDQGVTGLAWAFDGCCLYSCSMDNSIRSWTLRGTALHEAPFPSNSPSHKGSSDHPNAFDSCFGLALSPGNLVAAVVRNFDPELLDPMYQARTQKAAVEFFWTGGLQLGSPSDEHQDCSIETFPGLSHSDLSCWESNILWSLKSYDHAGGLLVLWDVISALLVFKKSASNYVEAILFKWLSSWFLSHHPGLATEEILFQAPNLFPKIDSRHLHLLNIICRRVMLSEMKVDILDSKQHKLGGLNDDEHAGLKLWIELLICSERELRERLVAFTFAAVLSHVSCTGTTLPSGTCWLPVGVAQMEQWVTRNHDQLQDQLKCLGPEVGKLGRRLHYICEYVLEEKCSFCSASVPFESPEVAFCKGVECNDNVGQSHKQARCSVSMKVCPTTPLWFCVCCQRWASKLAPRALFRMSKFPLDLRSLNESSSLLEYPKPLCPFCGVLLQRLLPDFLLSASPV
ncbi:uncharacterized protein LOC131234044 isoform X2 [Magnolia sinica]|uniref:uncharacterized protein LOC131234044 isoform X2 n=1 Tax=Magnolia sinica TaxID=86752 RepID=UPI0026594504|nr:uncharacterized protein LOC131234044 isoform X2 [Magnolia sinica]